MGMIVRKNLKVFKIQRQKTQQNVSKVSPDTSAEYLERGYDDEKKMHYYKVYFN